MATVYVPIRTIALQTSSGAGNVYWKQLNLTSFQGQVPAMKADLDSAIYGQVVIPLNLSISNAVRQVSIFWVTTATSGAARLNISTATTAPPLSYDITPFNAETAVDQNVSTPTLRINGTAFAPITTLFTGGNLLIVKFERIGSHANDTLTSDVEVVDWGIACEI